MGSRRKVRMRYYIISGSVREGRECYISLDSVKRPRKKLGKGSVASQIERNTNEAYKRLARVINCNFVPGDLWIQLMYKLGKEPTREQAERDGKNFLERVGREYQKRYGRKLKYVHKVGDVNPRTGADVPVHHHLVLPADAWEIVQRHWPLPHLGYKPLDGRRDYTGVARYIVGNGKYEKSKKKWSTSRGMKKPRFTTPRPVATLGGFRVPKNADVREREIYTDNDSGCMTAYIRYVMPEPGDESERDLN